MRVGLIGTGAIANKHAQAYKNIGFELVACSNRTPERGQEFADRWGAKFVPDFRDLCRYEGLDFIDVCTFPDSHLRTGRGLRGNQTSGPSAKADCHES